jgi:hypothetical protein
MKAAIRGCAVCAILILGLSCTAKADDGAASIGAGGLVARRETGVTMAEEVLRISWNSVAVDYEFPNDTDHDITTEVAFPIPPYQFDWDEFTISRQGFDDFRLWVNGKPTKFQTDVRATMHDHDVTALLSQDRIDIASFGHFDEASHIANDVLRLSKAQREALLKAGLIDSLDPDTNPTWTVEKKYYWLQRFPAHSTTHIRHTYTPVTGAQDTDSETMAQVPSLLYTKSPKYPLDVLKSMCPDQPFLEHLYAREKNGDPVLFWVDFILTTANTWKRPIENFTLIVDRPHGPKDGQVLVSFCSPGEIRQTSPNEFRVQVRNFVPKRELRIGFIQLSTPQPTAGRR